MIRIPPKPRSRACLLSPTVLRRMLPASTPDSFPSGFKGRNRDHDDRLLDAAADEPALTYGLRVVRTCLKYLGRRGSHR